MSADLFTPPPPAASQEVFTPPPPPAAVGVEYKTADALLIITDAAPWRFAASTVPAFPWNFIKLKLGASFRFPLPRSEPLQKRFCETLDLASEKQGIPIFYCPDYTDVNPLQNVRAWRVDPRQESRRGGHLFPWSPGPTLDISKARKGAYARPRRLGRPLDVVYTTEPGVNPFPLDSLEIGESITGPVPNDPDLWAKTEQRLFARRNSGIVMRVRTWDDGDSGETRFMAWRFA